MYYVYNIHVDILDIAMIYVYNMCKTRMYTVYIYIYGTPCIYINIIHEYHTCITYIIVIIKALMIFHDIMYSPCSWKM